jgi:hypothetical protein
MARAFVSGSSQYLEHVGVPVTTTPLTLAAWFYAAQTTSSYGLVGVGVGAGTTTVINGFQLYATSGTVKIASGNGTTAATAVTTATFAANAWAHAAAVFTSGTSRAAYLNGGNKVSNTTSSTPGTPDAVDVGRMMQTTKNYMNGRLAEAAVWNVALTDAEVAALAAGVSPLRVRPANLVAYWPLLGIDSPETDWHPAGGTRYPLTVTGATKGNHAPVEPYSRRFWGTTPAVVAGGPPPPAAFSPAAVLGHL